MEDTFKRILALARRTGDRLIVTDPEGKDAFVLLSLDQYEEILGGLPAGRQDPKDEPEIPSSSPPLQEEILSSAPADFAILQPSPEPAISQVITPASPSQTTLQEGHTPIPLKEDTEFGEEQFYLEPLE